MQAAHTIIAAHLAHEKKPVVVLTGPTASGKTALSLELAHAFNGEIISADSRQVYKYMDIGTDKIMPADRQGIPHYMIDVVEPSQRFTVGDFKRETERLCEEILARGKVPMIVGGTGLYIRTVVHNFSLPPEDKAVRAELMSELERDGPLKLHEKLAHLDPKNGALIHPNNTPYVIRALEILLSTGTPKNAQKNPPLFDFVQLGLSWPREILFERIGQRVEAQFERGLLDEVRGLLAKGFSKTLQSMSSLGYREVVAFLENRLPLDQAKEEIKKNTRNFAKRQLTWFKNEPDIRWLEMDRESC